MLQPEQYHHPEKVKVIESGYSGTPSFYRTFAYCSGLKYIILPAELTTFEARLDDCPACVIYYNNDEDHAKDLLKNNYYLRNAVQNGHQLLCLCHVTFDAKGGNLTYDKVPVYETEKSLRPWQTIWRKPIWMPSIIPPVRVTISSAGTPPQMASPKMASLM